MTLWWWTIEQGIQRGYMLIVIPVCHQTRALSTLKPWQCGELFQAPGQKQQSTKDRTRTKLGKQGRQAPPSWNRTCRFWSSAGTKPPLDTGPPSSRPGQRVSPIWNDFKDQRKPLQVSSQVLNKKVPGSPLKSRPWTRARWNRGSDNGRRAVAGSNQQLGCKKYKSQVCTVWYFIGISQPPDDFQSKPAAELVLGVKSWGEQPVPVFVLQQICQGLGSISAWERIIVWSKLLLFEMCGGRLGWRTCGSPWQLASCPSWRACSRWWGGRGAGPPTGRGAS